MKKVFGQKPGQVPGQTPIAQAAVKAASRNVAHELAAMATSQAIAGAFFGPDVIVNESVDSYNRRGNGRATEIAIAISDLVVGNRNSGEVAPSESLRIGGVVSTVEALLRKATPSDKAQCISLAQAWREKDDFLGKLVKIVMDFSITGLGFHIQAAGGKGKKVNAETPKDEIPEDEYSEATEFLRLFDKKFKLRKVVRDLLQDYKVTDSMILYWKMKPKADRVSADTVPEVNPLPAGPYDDLVPGLVDISALNPADVEWNNQLGMDILSVKIPSELESRIKSAIERDKSNPRGEKVKLTNDTILNVAENIKSLVASGVHFRWIEAVAMGLKSVELRNADGDYWLIKTQERKHHGLAKPSMSPVFVALTTRQLLSEGEFTAAFITKHFIMLIQAGESILQGPMAGQRNNYLTQPEANDLNSRFSDISKAMKVVVDHTVSIKFIFPPKEFFNREKFANCEGRILNWADVTYAVTEGEGGSYGSGFIGIKRLLASIIVSRNDAGELITDFFDHPSIRERVEIDEESDVIATYDEQILKEPQQLLREIEFLFKAAIMDARTAASELGRNPDRLRQSKRRTRREDAEDGSWSPVNNAAANADTSSTVDKGGRPNNPDTTPNPDTRLQTGTPNS